MQGFLLQPPKSLAPALVAPCRRKYGGLLALLLLPESMPKVRAYLRWIDVQGRSIVLKSLL